MNNITVTRRQLIGGFAAVGALAAIGPAIADELVDYNGPITKIITPIPATESALNNINVRRLLNQIEKSISEAMQFALFEHNDAFTRQKVKNITATYLQGLQQQRALYQYMVVCDEMNNTPEAIDKGELALDVHLQPMHLIEYITVNFKTVPTAIKWTEIENV